MSAEGEAQAGSMFELSLLKNMSFGWAAFVFGFVSDYCVVIAMDSECFVPVFVVVDFKHSARQPDGLSEARRPTRRMP